MGARQSAKRREVKMVVVIVAYQDRIDWRKVFEGNPGIAMAPRSEPFHGTDSV
jgi:hypothetical protein